MEIDGKTAAEIACAAIYAATCYESDRKTGYDNDFIFSNKLDRFIHYCLLDLNADYIRKRLNES